MGYNIRYLIAARQKDRFYYITNRKGEALKEAFRIVRDHGALDISDEYGSIEISDRDFVAR
jgi:hypothetical protein